MTLKKEKTQSTDKNMPEFPFVRHKPHMRRAAGVLPLETCCLLRSRLSDCLAGLPARTSAMVRTYNHVVQVGAARISYSVLTLRLPD